MESIFDVTIFGYRFKASADKGRLFGRKWQVMGGRGSWIGAGYIGGFTAFLALDCTSPYNTRKRSMYTRRALQLGFTRNGTRVPFTSN
jgi:hypothetical protein